jgi:hypothetical protein
MVFLHSSVEGTTFDVSAHMARHVVFQVTPGIANGLAVEGTVVAPLFVDGVDSVGNDSHDEMFDHSIGDHTSTRSSSDSPILDSSSPVAHRYVRAGSGHDNIPQYARHSMGANELRGALEHNQAASSSTTTSTPRRQSSLSMVTNPNSNSNRDREREEEFSAEPSSGS